MDPSKPGPLTTSTCGRPQCTADIPAARSALDAGDYARAFEFYQCANTAEAAFGAGLTRTLLILEGANAAAVLADFGEGPLPATDIFGGSGLLSREAARWQGQGKLLVSGAVALEVELNRAQQRIPADTAADGFGRFRAEDWQSPQQAELSISLGYPSPTSEPLVSGATLGVSFNCAGTFPTRTADARLSSVSFSFDQAGVQQRCSLPYFSAGDSCEADGGSVLVKLLAASPGQQASYTLQNLLLSCSPDVEQAASSVEPASEPPKYLVRLNGDVSALGVSEERDTTGLHPVLAGDFVLDHIPPNKTGTDLIQHSGAAAAELEEAACFFARAGQASGNVFTIPSVLFGGSDSPVSGGDSQVLAGLALLGAATAELFLAHDLSMPLGQMFCDSDVSPTPCLTDPEYVSAFNQAIATGFYPERFATSKRLMGEALPLLDSGMAKLDGSSLLVRNEISSRGLGMLREVVRAVHSSFASSTEFPHVTPAVALNLGAFFGNPRNPRNMSAPMLRHVEECDLDVCTSNTEMAPAFRDEYFKGSIEADWEADHEFADDDAVADATREMARNAGGLFLGGN